ncbi:MAG: hypothetical protein PHG81_12870 [Aliarcobacter sp.]|nr:hypothetical protein [Aliarcobacter sp.]
MKRVSINEIKKNLGFRRLLKSIRMNEKISFDTFTSFIFTLFVADIITPSSYRRLQDLAHRVYFKDVFNLK